MRHSSVSKRYAKSLLDLAVELGQLEQAYTDVKTVSEAIKANRELQLLLNSPIISPEKKLSLMTAVFEGRVSDMLLKFVRIITVRNRETLLPEILESFITLYKKHQNILTAEIISAVPLDKVNREKALALIKQMSQQVELSEKVDPKLIGGFIIRVGDRQIDASVANRLADLKNEFSNNTYIAH